MNAHEIQVTARDKKLVSSTERVKISSTNLRLETTVPQKEEKFQVVIDIIKNSTCFKAFTISADVLEIFMQQSWYTIKKFQGTKSYEFLLANKKCRVDAEVFRKILGICLRVKGTLYKYTNMYVDHMSQPWRTLTEDFAYQIDQMRERKSRRENIPYPRFTKVIINYFLKQHKYLFNIKYQHYHTIKDDVRALPDVHQETIDVSEESEPVKRKTASRRVVKKKVIIFADDNIIPNPDVTLELGKYIILAEAEEEEVAKEVHATYARIMTAPVPESAKKKIEEDQLDDKEKDDIEGDVEDEGNDHISDTQDTDDEDDENESDEDEIYKYKICVCKDEDVEMTNAKFEDFEKGDAKISNVAQAEVEKTEEIKDAPKKAELPSTSSSLSVSSAPESSKIQTPTIKLEQESKKSALEILKIKKEQAKKQKMPKYTIKSTNKASLKEYDQKSALYQTMHENKSFNRNPTNHRLYHALIEALIEDKNAVDKGIAGTIKDHKRKHDDDDDDPPAGPNQGKKTKRRRTKESKSSKKPSSTKETPKGKAPSKGSKTGKFASIKEPVEEPIAEVDPLTFIDLMDTLINFSNDCNNPEGYRYPFDLSKPLPLQGRPGHLTAATDYFFNNDLEYLKSFDPDRTYTTSIIKTKEARYEIAGIEDMVHMLWSTIKHAYDKDAAKGIKHWGKMRKLWYICQLNKFSKHNVYSTQKILSVKSVNVKKLHGYGHLEEVVVKRANQQLCKFKEGDFVDLHLNDIEDMLLLVVQHKKFHLNESDIVDFIMALWVIYEDLVKQKRVMQADELYKFLDGTLKKVRDELHHRILGFCLGYNDETSRRKWTAIDKKRSELMVELIDKKMRKRRIIGKS
uniref:Uncharacterized protein n=1 Tax=Tanacetum cinerariifolium TaxID=118510 RepID=A0A6L2MN30_TANCI|nr:hypothetical protein [Tanacetum cinerariifolium]